MDGEGQNPLERRVVGYDGNVQGVGFRFRTMEIASRYDVFGFVENLSDGSVRLLVEGEPSELDRFLADVLGTLRRFIRGTHVVREPATREFVTFEIRH